MSLTRDLINDVHVHRLVVTRDLEGWEVREEEDSTILRRTRREDWHRVETDIQLFDIKARTLKGEGWHERF
jgi:hypothetical protein